MTVKRALIILFWIAAICIPVVSSIIAAIQLPTDTAIPMHWNAQNQIDRYGSPWEMLPVSLIMSGCNLLLAISYVFTDKLFDLELVHGISRKATRPFLCGTAVFMVLVWIGILVFWLYKVSQASF